MTLGEADNREGQAQPRRGQGGLVGCKPELAGAARRDRACLPHTTPIGTLPIPATISFHCRCSEGSNFGQPLVGVLVVPADRGFPGSPRLFGDVVRLVVEATSV